MARISIDNGFHYLYIDENKDEIIRLWDSIVEYMDDETREAVHMEIAPCTEIEFLKRYLEIASNDLIIG